MIKMVSYVFAMAMALVTATFFVSCGGTKHVLTTTANEGIIYCGAMIDSSKGYAVGDDGAIRLTTDGGKNWAPAAYKGGPLFSLSVASDTVCYAGGDHSEFIRTTDGGATWQTPAKFPLKKMKGLTFLNEERGWAWSQGDIYEYDGVTDSWKNVAKPAGVVVIESVCGVAAGKGFVCDNNGNLFYTENYGKSWKEIQKLYDRKTDALKPVVAQWTKTAEFDVQGNVIRFAYLAEENYVYSLVIWKSTDGGRTFAKEEQIKLPNIAKAICFNRTNGISVYNTDCTMDFYQLS